MWGGLPDLFGGLSGLFGLFDLPQGKSDGSRASRSVWAFSSFRGPGAAAGVFRSVPAVLLDVKGFAAVAALILGIAVVLTAGRKTDEHADGEVLGLVLVRMPTGMISLLGGNTVPGLLWGILSADFVRRLSRRFRFSAP